MEEGDVRFSLRNSLLALTYASSKGIALNKEIIDTIVESKNALQNQEGIDNQLEQKFWPAYSQLMQSIKPATIDSIKFLENGDKSVKRIATYYRLIGLAALLIMVAVQIYWVVGSGLISDYKTIPGEIEKLQKDIDDRIEILGEDAAEDTEVRNTEAKVMTLRGQLVTNFKAVGFWNRIWKKLFMSDGSTDADPSVAAALEYRSSIFALQAMEVYILPLLYGLLGAFAYVLRSIATETREKYYTNQSNLNYVLRLHLGAFAGLAIGWFIGPSSTMNDQDLVRGLSPLALAFLGGYSVDILFLMMDRIIGSVSNKS